ncbi:class I SAM-dependent methyltransferase [Kutzneria kofuensis]|uniref:Ubiquinone/menaquinone biosynthesis C-methylase UbiE n=1 Tax=Kutzneria kofuensis TaxID=103725 RepID=A0A7W9KPI2_9PSEU|nr:class I SAM-dependent methyltransferase [Kutzneria kofuensis]MBB5896354.1 ubiquinone/menaquinone biosynthesis C-methylase UbiE [Kutzneria kofuensis]
MSHAFIDRWVDRFDTVYDETALGRIPWFTASPGIKVIEAVITGLIKRGDRVVDLGCGPGCDAVFLASAGVDTVAFDRDETALRKARQLADWAGVTVELVQGDILATGLPAESFDVVNDSFVFHNVRAEARAAYAGEAARILKPGGTLLVSAFSDRMVDGTGPLRISAAELFDTFRPAVWECLSLENYRNLPTEARPGQFHWFGVFRKREEPTA